MNQPRCRRGLFAATVIANDAVCRDHFRLTLSVAGLPPTAPGQFVQLACQPMPDRPDEPTPLAWPADSPPDIPALAHLQPTPLLRRPFSLAGDRPDPADPMVRQLDIIGRVVGLGSSRLARLAPGDRIDLLGPLGNSFPMPEANQTALLVGGGVGIPPMIYLAETLARSGRAAIALAGATTADLLPLTIRPSVQPDRAGRPTLSIEEFARLAIPSVVASDDGSVGFRGLVSEALTRLLDDMNVAPGRQVIYVCGPERMMQAVSQVAMRRSIRVYVAMERSMACGMGTCQSCACKVRLAEPPGWQYKLVCTDGTIFDGSELLWD